MPRERLVMDCSTGEQRVEQFSAEEEAAADQDQATLRAERAAREAETENLKAAVTSHSDPVVRALGARLGIV